MNSVVKKSVNKLIQLVILILILNGCAAPPIKPIDTSLNRSNSGILSISRQSAFVNALVSYRIFVNGEYIGALNNGSRLIRRVPQGESFIEFKAVELGGIPTTGSEELKLAIDSGYKYDVNMNFNVESVVVIGNISSVGKSTNLYVNRTPEKN